MLVSRFLWRRVILFYKNASLMQTAAVSEFSKKMTVKRKLQAVILIIRGRNTRFIQQAADNLDALYKLQYIVSSIDNTGLRGRLSSVLYLDCIPDYNYL